MGEYATCNRRTVLRATGTALAAAVVGTGTASAVCAYTVRDTDMNLPGDDRPCGTSEYFIRIPANTSGEIRDDCYGLMLFDTGQEYGWVPSDDLVYCWE